MATKKTQINTHTKHWMWFSTKKTCFWSCLPIFYTYFIQYIGLISWILF